MRSIGAPHVIDRYIEIGEIVVDRQKPHFLARRTPVGDKNPTDPAVLQCPDHAVAGREIRHRRAMQRERRADERRHASIAYGEVPKLHGAQFEAQIMTRRPDWRVICNGFVVGTRHKPYELIERIGDCLASGSRHQCWPREKIARQVRYARTLPR
jgi:hypothetical protein